MARKVRVSAVGPAPFLWDRNADDDQIAAQAIAHLEHWLGKALLDRPDLIVLYENCDRPQGMPQERCRAYYRARGERVRARVREIARREGVNIALPTALACADGSFRNAISFIGRGGEIRGTYHKNHLVWEEYSQMGIRFGKDAPVIEMDFGTVAGAICFDLNFDELREKYARSRPELLVFASMYHGGFVQRNWAYTCRCWFVGAVAGQPCSVVNPLGEVVAQSTNYYAYVTYDINLDCAVAHLDYNWEKLDALRGKYGKEVTIFDPGRLGSVLITSESAAVSAREMAREFGIELLDDYMARSLRHRHMPGRIED